jgi:hypothetical protein
VFLVGVMVRAIETWLAATKAAGRSGGQGNLGG